MLKEIFILQISGEYLICLAKSGFLYFNWLTRRLERRIDNPLVESGEYDLQASFFTCICCNNNDVDVLIGCANGCIY